MWGRGETGRYWLWLPSPIGQHKLTEFTIVALVCTHTVAESMFSVHTWIFETKKTGLIYKHFDWNLIRCLHYTNAFTFMSSQTLCFRYSFQ